MEANTSGRLAAVLLALALVFAVGCERLALPKKKDSGPDPQAPGATAAEAMDPVKIEMPEPVPEPAFVPDRRSQVSVLLYHDFADAPSSNPMKIEVEKFRQQMQALKDSEIAVIRMEDYLRWKRGEINIPNPAVIITIDDGWREVYTRAFPILKEFGFPFTLFLYTNYLNSGGARALTTAQIEEMLGAGASVGSHGVGHLDMTLRRGLSEEGYRDFVVRELKESREKLRELFGDRVLNVFSYPYGRYNQEVVALAKEHGYEAALTVDGRKDSWNTPLLELGRYIIHGNDDRNFGYALATRGSSTVAAGKNLLRSSSGDGNSKSDTAESPVSTFPSDQEIITDRMPLIQVNLSALPNLDSGSLVMTVSGFGRVPAVYSPETGIFSYQMRQRLRDRECSVNVALKRAGAAEVEFVAWKFFVDRVSYYLPKPVKKAEAVEISGERDASATGPETASQTAASESGS